MDNSYNTPIYSAIKDYLDINPVAFHMPGHKLGKGIPEEFARDMARLDLTEIPGTDNLHNPCGAIMEAQQLAARAFGADRTFFLVNGSTCGIHAMIMAVCRSGDRLIVGRDSHKSVINGMLMAGVQPVYITPEVNYDFAVPSVVSYEKLEKLLDENTDVKGVLLTRPNYYGICSDISKIADVVHAHGKLLMVDEAHGAHLRFSSRLPVCAMDAGADICVQSAHKTLPALTQGAYLHVREGKIDIDRLSFHLSMLQTSSPSYILMSNLDIARAIMERDGGVMLGTLLDRVGTAKERLENMEGLAVLEESPALNARLDGTRLTVNVNGLGKTGFEVDSILRSRFGIQVEMADCSNLVLISAVPDRDEDFIILEKAFRELTSGLDVKYGAGNRHDAYLLNNIYSNLPGQRMSFREALDCASQRITLAKAIGRVCRSIVTPYPPGIPVICPGEEISSAAVEYIHNIIKNKGIVTGLENKMEVSVVA